MSIQFSVPNLKLKTSINSQFAFTLIEVMVVVFLVALTAGIVSISFRHDSTRLVETEARRFVALIEQMCQESIIQARVFAVTSEGATAYRFVVLENDKWLPVKQDDVFRLHQLPEDIGLKIDIDDYAESDDDTYLRCEPDGFMTPFSAVFDLDGIRYTVLTNEMREMEIRAAEN